jgi:serine/threonine-protein kinase HipA
MAQAVSDVVAKVEGYEPINAAEQRILAAGGTLGGVQPKALMALKGEEWIVKFPRKDDSLDSPRVEHASMTLAKLAGIRVADTRVVPLKGGQAVAIRRFGRAGAQTYAKLPRRRPVRWFRSP